MRLDPKIQNFLKMLVVNNNREWFNDNKNLYEEAKSLFEEFTQAQIAEILKFDKQVDGLQVKDCSFRIYRDVRFSHDKTPYKIHFGAYMADGGRKSPFAGYYTHIEPDASLLAGGIHLPHKDILKQIRTQIYENPEPFKAILNDSRFKKFFPQIYGDKLIGAPRGFDKSFPDLDLIKHKSYDLYIPLSDEDLESKYFFEDSLKVFELLLPLNTYFNEIVKRT